jgi:hypothetical protein
VNVSSANETHDKDKNLVKRAFWEKCFNQE